MPNFTFTRDRPAGSQTPAEQRPTLTINNNSTDSILGIDLYGFNNNNGGYHQKSTYVNQLSDPGSAASQLVEYSKSVTYANAAGTFSELFLQRDAVSTPIQMTTGPGNPSVAENGQCYLPGGMIMKWGVRPTGAGSTVTYPTPFPNTTLNVTATSYGSSAAVGITGALNRNNFSFSGNDQFFWKAIGY